MASSAAQHIPQRPNREFRIPVHIPEEELDHTTSQFDPVSKTSVAVFDVLEDILAPVAGTEATSLPTVIAVPSESYCRVLVNTQLLDSTKPYVYNVDFLIDDNINIDNKIDINNKIDAHEKAKTTKKKLTEAGLGERLEHISEYEWDVRFFQKEDIYQAAQENVNVNGNACRKVIFTTVERVKKANGWGQGVTRIRESCGGGVVLLPSCAAAPKDTNEEEQHVPSKGRGLGQRRDRRKEQVLEKGLHRNNPIVILPSCEEDTEEDEVQIISEGQMLGSGRGLGRGRVRKRGQVPEKGRIHKKTRIAEKGQIPKKGLHGDNPVIIEE